MDAPRSQTRFGVSIVLLISVSLVISGCSGLATPQSIFLPPTSEIQPTFLPATIVASPFAIPTLLPLSPTPAIICSNSLIYIEDLTFPDGIEIKPGSEVDKQWQVENNGTCNWDVYYSFRQTSGDDFGIGSQLALYPARAGTRVVIHVNFIAPRPVGTYMGVWQAYDPTGQAFGDPLSVLLVVSP